MKYTVTDHGNGLRSQKLEISEREKQLIADLQRKYMENELRRRERNERMATDRDSA